MVKNYGSDGKPIDIKGRVIKAEDAQGIYEIIERIEKRRKTDGHQI